MKRHLSPAVAIGMSALLVLGLVEESAAQVLEPEVRPAPASAYNARITPDHAVAFLRFRDHVVRGHDRIRRLEASRDAFRAELEHRHADAGRVRLAADNARLEEANRHLRKEIAAERERRLRRVLVRWFVEIPVNIAVTTVTGNPAIGAAVSSGLGTALTGGDVEDVVVAAARSGLTAGASQLAADGIDQLSTAVADSVAARVADKLAVYDLPPDVVAKATQEVAVKVARAVDAGLHMVTTEVMPGQGPVGTLDRLANGFRVAAAGAELLTPVTIDLEAVPGLLVEALPDDPDAYIQALVEQGKANAVQVAASLDATDSHLITGLQRKLDIGNGMKGALSVGVFGGVLTSKSYGEAITELGAMGTRLPTTADALRSLNTITACAIAKDIQEHLLGYQLDHGQPMEGERGEYFSALQNQWSTRCAR